MLIMGLFWWRLSHFAPLHYARCLMEGVDAVALLTVWYTSGLSYFISVMLVPQNAMVAVVAITMVIGGFLNGVEPRLRNLSTFMKGVEGKRANAISSSVLKAFGMESTCRN